MFFLVTKSGGRPAFRFTWRRIGNTAITDTDTTLKSKRLPSQMLAAGVVLLFICQYLSRTHIYHIYRTCPCPVPDISFVILKNEIKRISSILIADNLQVS